MAANGASAGPFEDGLAAAQRQDYATALRLWKPLAAQGNAEAQNNLGVMYGFGTTVSSQNNKFKYLHPLRSVPTFFRWRFF